MCQQKQGVCTCVFFLWGSTYALRDRKCDFQKWKEMKIKKWINYDVIQVGSQRQC